MQKGHVYRHDPFSKKTMKNTYKIADIIFEVILPFGYEEMEEYELYQVRAGAPDFTIEFKNKDYLIPEGKRKFSHVYNRITETDDSYYYELLDGDFRNTYGCLIFPKQNPKVIHGFLKKNAQKLLPHSTQVFKALSIENLLMYKKAFILHASYIKWHGKGILFSAPSGTGKSTQAELWERYEHAEIINGDRVALREKEGSWNAYGLPYAGSSGVFKNVTTMVGALIILKQGSENRLKKADGKEAVMSIYSESIVHTWDKVYLEKLMDMIISLVNRVPVYILSCRADESAVELLKRELSDQDGFGRE